MARNGTAFGIVLWIVALGVVLAAARHQRTTGPTYPLSTEVTIGGVEGTVVLPRSGITDAPATVTWPADLPVDTVRLQWRRYPSDDVFTTVAFTRGDDGALEAALPLKPAAGKLEYRVVATDASGTDVTLPVGDDPPVLRYKDPVPAGVLVPHVAMMFLSMLFGVRAALAAAAGRPETRWLVPVTAIGLTIGGMILGPVVQKYAFGAYWTGWPNGGDLTDNKTLIMWGVWILVAGLFVLRGAWRPTGVGRIATLVAALVMLTVYLIPHSLRGSQLDYEALDAGVEAHEAIRTGGD